jgi:hypothetical protein
LGTAIRPKAQSSKKPASYFGPDALNAAEIDDLNRKIETDRSQNRGMADRGRCARRRDRKVEGSPPDVTYWVAGLCSEAAIIEPLSIVILSLVFKKRND